MQSTVVNTKPVCTLTKAMAKRSLRPIDVYTEQLLPSEPGWSIKRIHDGLVIMLHKRGVLIGCVPSTRGIANEFKGVSICFFDPVLNSVRIVDVPRYEFGVRAARIVDAMAPHNVGRDMRGDYTLIRNWFDELPLDMITIQIPVRRTPAPESIGQQELEAIDVVPIAFKPTEFIPINSVPSTTTSSTTSTASITSDTKRPRRPPARFGSFVSTSTRDLTQ